MKGSIYAIVSLCFLVACSKKNSGAITPPKMLHIHAQGDQLVDENNTRFRVWGFNYGAGDPGLTEKLWTSAARWSELKQDFKDMKDLGANSVRLHLQAHEFLIDPNKIAPQKIEGLKRTVAIAQEQGLYLLITGLGAYLKKEQPSWYTSLNDSMRWVAHETFWREIAKAVGSSPVILGYDLMNEPITGGEPEQGWTPGKPFGGYNYIQNIALNSDKKPLLQVLTPWIDKLSAAIRISDQKHFITVGYLSFPIFATTAPHLSCMSTHLYPPDESSADAQSIQTFKTSIPLLITEIFPLNSSAENVEKFIRNQNRNVSGWMWHYGGKTPEEMGEPKTLAEALHKEALIKFREMAPEQK